MEQWDSIESSPPQPFVPSRDPLALYDEACAAYEDDASSRHHGKSMTTPEDEDNIQEDDGDDGDDDDGDDEDYEDE